MSKKIARIRRTLNLFSGSSYLMHSVSVHVYLLTFFDSKGFSLLRLLFVLATEHTLLRMFLNIWRQILFSGDLHDDTL